VPVPDEASAKRADRRLACSDGCFNIRHHRMRVGSPSELERAHPRPPGAWAAVSRPSPTRTLLGARCGCARRLPQTCAVLRDGITEEEAAAIKAGKLPDAGMLKPRACCF
jgi:hypothetical protein